MRPAGEPVGAVADAGDRLGLVGGVRVAVEVVDGGRSRVVREVHERRAGRVDDEAAQRRPGLQAGTRRHRRADRRGHLGPTDEPARIRHLRRVPLRHGGGGHRGDRAGGVGTPAAGHGQRVREQSHHGGVPHANSPDPIQAPVAGPAPAAGGQAKTALAVCWLNALSASLSASRRWTGMNCCPGSRWKQTKIRPASRSGRRRTTTGRGRPWWSTGPDRRAPRRYR